MSFRQTDNTRSPILQQEGTLGLQQQQHHHYDDSTPDELELHLGPTQRLADAPPLPGPTSSSQRKYVVVAGDSSSNSSRRTSSHVHPQQRHGSSLSLISPKLSSQQSGTGSSGGGVGGAQLPGTVLDSNSLTSQHNKANSSFSNNNKGIVYHPPGLAMTASLRPPQQQQQQQHQFDMDTEGSQSSSISSLSSSVKYHHHNNAGGGGGQYQGAYQQQISGKKSIIRASSPPSTMETTTGALGEGSSPSALPGQVPPLSSSSGGGGSGGGSGSNGVAERKATSNGVGGSSGGGGMFFGLGGGDTNSSSQGSSGLVTKSSGRGQVSGQITPVNAMTSASPMNCTAGRSGEDGGGYTVTNSNSPGVSPGGLNSISSGQSYLMNDGLEHQHHQYQQYSSGLGPITSAQLLLDAASGVGGGKEGGNRHHHSGSPPALPTSLFDRRSTKPWVDVGSSRVKKKVTGQETGSEVPLGYGSDELTSSTFRVAAPTSEGFLGSGSLAGKLCAAAHHFLVARCLPPIEDCTPSSHPFAQCDVARGRATLILVMSALGGFLLTCFGGIFMYWAVEQEEGRSNSSSGGGGLLLLASSTLVFGGVNLLLTIIFRVTTGVRSSALMTTSSRLLIALSRTRRGTMSTISRDSRGSGASSLPFLCWSLCWLVFLTLVSISAGPFHVVPLVLSLAGWCGLVALTHVGLSHSDTTDRVPFYFSLSYTFLVSITFTLDSYYSEWGIMAVFIASSHSSPTGNSSSSEYGVSGTVLETSSDWLVLRVVMGVGCIILLCTSLLIGHCILCLQATEGAYDLQQQNEETALRSIVANEVAALHAEVTASLMAWDLDGVVALIALCESYIGLNPNDNNNNVTHHQHQQQYLDDSSRQAQGSSVSNSPRGGGGGGNANTIGEGNDDDDATSGGNSNHQQASWQKSTQLHAATNLAATLIPAVYSMVIRIRTEVLPLAVIDGWRVLAASLRESKHFLPPTFMVLPRQGASKLGHLVAGGNGNMQGGGAGPTYRPGGDGGGQEGGMYDPDEGGGTDMSEGSILMTQEEEEVEGGEEEDDDRPFTEEELHSVGSRLSLLSRDRDGMTPGYYPSSSRKERSGSGLPPAALATFQSSSPAPSECLSLPGEIQSLGGTFNGGQSLGGTFNGGQSFGGTFNGVSHAQPRSAGNHRQHYTAPIVSPTAKGAAAAGGRHNTKGGGLPSTPNSNGNNLAYYNNNMKLSKELGVIVPKRITMICLNISDFHVIVRKTGMEASVRIQKYVLSTIQKHVAAQRGVIDYFQGDHVFASFNAVTPAASHAKKGALAALNAIEEIEASAEFDLPAVPAAAPSALVPRSPGSPIMSHTTNTTHAASNSQGAGQATHSTTQQPTAGLRMTCGLSSGVAAVGVMGTHDRRRICTVGPVVSQTSILERLTKVYEGVKVLVPGAALGDIGFECLYQAVDIVALPGGKPNVVASLESKLVGQSAEANTEWMYQLQQQQRADPFAHVNAAFVAAIDGDVETALRCLAVKSSHNSARSRIGERGAMAVIHQLQEGRSRFNLGTDLGLYYDKVAPSSIKQEFTLVNNSSHVVVGGGREHHQPQNHNNNTNNNSSSSIHQNHVVGGSSSLANLSFTSSSIHNVVAAAGGSGSESERGSEAGGGGRVSSSRSHHHPRRSSNPNQAANHQQMYPLSKEEGCVISSTPSSSSGNGSATATSGVTSGSAIATGGVGYAELLETPLGNVRRSSLTHSQSRQDSSRQHVLGDENNNSFDGSTRSMLEASAGNLRILLTPKGTSINRTLNYHGATVGGGPLSLDDDDDGDKISHQHPQDPQPAQVNKNTCVAEPMSTAPAQEECAVDAVTATNTTAPVEDGLELELAGETFLVSENSK